MFSATPFSPITSSHCMRVERVLNESFHSVPFCFHFYTTQILHNTCPVPFCFFTLISHSVLYMPRTFMSSSRGCSQRLLGFVFLLFLCAHSFQPALLCIGLCCVEITVLCKSMVNSIILPMHVSTYLYMKCK